MALVKPVGTTKIGMETYRRPLPYSQHTKYPESKTTIAFTKTQYSATYLSPESADSPR